MLLLFPLIDGLIRTFFAGEVVVMATVNERLFLHRRIDEIAKDKKSVSINTGSTGNGYVDRQGHRFEFEVASFVRLIVFGVAIGSPVDAGSLRKGDSMTVNSARPTGRVSILIYVLRTRDVRRRRLFPARS